MAKTIYAGHDNTSHKVKKLYVGVDGTAHKVKKVYAGGQDGLAHQVYSNGPSKIIVYTDFLSKQDSSTKAVFSVSEDGGETFNGPYDIGITQYLYRCVEFKGKFYFIADIYGALTRADTINGTRTTVFNYGTSYRQSPSSLLIIDGYLCYSLYNNSYPYNVVSRRTKDGETWETVSYPFYSWTNPTGTGEGPLVEDRDMNSRFYVDDDHNRLYCAVQRGFSYYSLDSWRNTTNATATVARQSTYRYEEVMAAITLNNSVIVFYSNINSNNELNSYPSAIAYDILASSQIKGITIKEGEMRMSGSFFKYNNAILFSNGNYLNRLTVDASHNISLTNVGATHSGYIKEFDGKLYMYCGSLKMATRNYDTFWVSENGGLTWRKTVDNPHNLTSPYEWMSNTRRSAAFAILE